MKLEPRNPRQADFIRSIHENTITFCTGYAGTGKTFLSVAMAWKLLKEKNSGIEKIIITRPVVETGAGKSNKYGALPGSLKEKIDPYMQPIYDEFKYFTDDLEDLITRNKVEIVPLEFMRGRNFYRSCVILDECQNATSKQIEMFITRIAKHSKMIISGDMTQSDLFPKDQGGLRECIEKLDDINGVGIIKFLVQDIVRHPILSKILYKLHGKEDDDCTYGNKDFSS